jgi:hypothetical protein
MWALMPEETGLEMAQKKGREELHTSPEDPALSGSYEPAVANRNIVAFIILLGIFMFVIDGSVVSIALPTITRYFRADVALVPVGDNFIPGYGDEPSPGLRKSGRSDRQGSDLFMGICSLYSGIRRLRPLLKPWHAHILSGPSSSGSGHGLLHQHRNNL